MIASAFFRSKRAGFGLTRRTSKAADQVGHREDVPVLGDGPAQQRQVVAQPLGQEAAVPVEVQVGRGVALGELLVALPHDQRQVPEARSAGGHPDVGQRGVQRQLAGRGGQQVLPAQHVGDPHQRVVDRVDQRVQRLTAGPGQHEVRHGTGGEDHLAADQVVPGQVRVWHPQPQHRGPSLGQEGRLLRLGGLPVGTVVTLLGVLAGGDPAGGHLLGRGERLVGVPGLDQPGQHVPVDLAAFGLPVRAVRAADLGPLVPVQPQPTQAVQQVPVGLLGVPRGVGVLDPEDELPTVVPGVRPVEQRRAHDADVHQAGG